MLAAPHITSGITAGSSTDTNTEKVLVRKGEEAAQKAEDAASKAKEDMHYRDSTGVTVMRVIQISMLGCAERSIYRDIRRLQGAGASVRQRQGRL